jgi:Family of unknown function (DUF6247)
VAPALAGFPAGTLCAADTEPKQAAPWDRLPGRPAETPAAIRAALAASAVPEVVAQYEAELDAAFSQARQTDDLTVLTSAVRRWWIEALEWQRDPAG